MPASLTLLRVSIASLIFIHGAVRALLGGVTPFGGWLSDKGFPLGVGIAWFITLMELLATPLLAAGRFVIPISAWFMVQLILGIIMVHAPEGWFVVGLGRNGAEYSVLLIVSFMAVILGERERRRADKARGAAPM